MVVTQDAGPARQQVEATCAECNKQTTVPFVPTPGRPVFCRECFAKRGGGPASRGPPGGGGGGGGFRGPPRGPPRGGSSYDRPRGPPQGNERKRMMAQGRKGHFIHDAKVVLSRVEGGMDDQHHRAFLEGLFARGARTSTQAAKDFLSEKLAEGAITPDEHRGLSDLVERYSFWR